MSSYTSSEGEEIDPIVCDHGSGRIRAGYGGDDEPKIKIPSAIGMLSEKDEFRSLDYITSHWTEHRIVPEPLVHSIKQYAQIETRYIGEDAEAVKDWKLWTLCQPVERGSVTNWDHMERTLHHIFCELRIDPKERQILLTDHVLSPKKDRAKKMELLFESFQVPSMYLAIDIVLALYASGRTTGLVLDVGHGVTSSITIYEGYTDGINGEINGCGAVHRQNIGGMDLNEYMRQLLAERGHHFNSAADLVHVRKIKEKLCYLATDFESELEDGTSKNTGKHYELPDGKIITVGAERFQCPEALFNPKLMGMDAKGIHEIVYNTIQKSAVDARRDFWCNIVLCGGTTYIPSLDERLRTELKQLAPSTVRSRVVAPPERRISVWIGGSILVSLSSFQEMWISKDEYDESGPHRNVRCMGQ